MGQVRYLDRFALVTRDFIECPMTAMASRSAWGLLTLVEVYVRQSDEIQRRCGIAPPHVIYELYWGSFEPKFNETLMGAGYRVVFLQDSDIAGGSKLFPGKMNFGRVHCGFAGSRRWRS